MGRLDYDTGAPKKAANLSINSDLLRQARELDLNLSGLLEEHLAEVVRRARRERWLAENQGAIDDYNERIAARGSYGDSERRF